MMRHVRNSMSMPKRGFKQFSPDAGKISGSLYDYFVDRNSSGLMSWSTKLGGGTEMEAGADEVESFKYSPNAPYYRLIVPTTDMICSKYLLNVLTLAKTNVLCVGETGVGKSTIVSKVFGKSFSRRFLHVGNSQLLCSNITHVSPQHPEARLEKRRKRFWHLLPESGQSFLSMISICQPWKSMVHSHPMNFCGRSLMMGAITRYRPLEDSKRWTRLVSSPLALRQAVVAMKCLGDLSDTFISSGFHKYLLHLCDKSLAAFFPVS